MSKLQRMGRWSLAVSAGALLAAGWVAGAGGGARAQVSTPSAAPKVVAMRCLSEPQYRNAIADIFGPEIREAGWFEPVVRPAHELIASGAFFADMLLFERFDDLSKDPIIYPYFNNEVAAALPEQMLRTVIDHLLVRGADYRTLCTTPRTFMTRSLGGLYGVPVSKPKGWEPFKFPAGDDRAGLLGQAGFLALYAHLGRSSPTLRGRAIRELLLCQPVPDPPGNVNFTAVQDINNKAKPTARIRFETHISDPVCAGCHTVIDPIGLGLDRFDGIGRWRSTENAAPIDASRRIDNLKFAGAPGLGKAIAAMPEATQCVAARALEYARGWPANEDGALVTALDKRFGASSYSIRALFQAVASLPEAAYQPKGGIEAGPGSGSRHVGASGGSDAGGERGDGCSLGASLADAGID